MYAIVHKNTVIAGPIEWNRAFFSVALERIGVENALLPRAPYESFPHAIDSETAVHKVSELRDEFNPMAQYLRGPLFTITDSEVVARYEVVDTEIQFARNNFKEQAAAERYKREVAGTKVTIQNQEVSVTTQRAEREDFTKKVAFLNDTDVVNWKFNEGWLQINKAELLQISSAIESHVQSSFDWEKSISDQINAAQTAQELLAIQIIEQSNTIAPALQQ